jgi:enoyl-CoA hydratase
MHCVRRTAKYSGKRPQTAKKRQSVLEIYPGEKMTDRIIQKKDGDIVTIQINRPDIGNRVTDEMAVQLADMLDLASKNARLIIFRGTGETFCLGRDEVKKDSNTPPEAYDLREEIEVVFNLYGAFRRSPVPIIGVVQGQARGFGCALAALCDITIASDQSRFQLPEMGHHIMPTMAMSALADRVSRKALLYLVYSTDEIDAQTALIFGLISQVVPADCLDKTVEKLVAALKKSPMPAIKAVKEYAASALTIDTQAANNFAKNLHATINSSSRMRH